MESTRSIGASAAMLSKGSLLMRPTAIAPVAAVVISWPSPNLVH